MMGRVLDEQDALGATTARYPSEAEEHAKRGWNDVLPLDDELEPARRPGAVDKVPRRWGSVIAFVLLCLCVGFGAVAGGFALFKWKSGESAALSPPRQTPAEPPRTEAKPIAQPVAQPSAQPIAQPSAQPIAQPTARPLLQPVAQPSAPTQAPAADPVAAPKPENAAVPPDREGAERLRQDAIAVRKRRQQRRSEADYVWSQELKALVPAESMERPPVQPRALPPALP